MNSCIVQYDNNYNFIKEVIDEKDKTSKSISEFLNCQIPDKLEN
jgi:hypothetical protein